jgi:hypothetical protein
MKVVFTQYLRPDGRTRPVYIERKDMAIQALAETLLANGCKFEVEELQTGEVLFECLDGEGESLSTAICSNGSQVPRVVDQLIQDAAKAMLILRHTGDTVKL